MSLSFDTDPKTLVDSQLTAALRKAQEIAAALGPPGEGIEAVRAHTARARQWWNEGGPEMAEVREDRIPGPIRDIPVMVYRPERATSLPVFVYLHGGGFRIGNAKSNDRQMRELAAAWGGVVISADYVHVPEYVFPSAVEETAALYSWLAENGVCWGIDGCRMAFGGVSAGGNVSLGAAIHLGGIRTGFLKAGVMIVAPLDRNLETESMRRFGGGAFFPSHSEVTATLGQYVPDPARRDDPRANCAAADPKLVPPLYLAAAELDTLLDSSRNMATRLAAAGRPHRLKIYSGMTHMFFGYSRMVDRSVECIRDIASFLAEFVPVR